MTISKSHTSSKGAGLRARPESMGKIKYHLPGEEVKKASAKNPDKAKETL